MATLFRGDSLLDELDAMTEELSRMAGIRPATSTLRGWLPPVDIWETEAELVIELDVPGCRPEDLSAEVIDRRLVVSGERAVNSEATRRYRSERWQGRFVRSFTVPDGMTGESVRASYSAGVLTLRLAKPEKQQPKRIAISHDDRALDAGDDGVVEEAGKA
jgi:HSP20 family protein